MATSRGVVGSRWLWLTLVIVMAALLAAVLVVTRGGSAASQEPAPEPLGMSGDAIGFAVQGDDVSLITGTSDDSPREVVMAVATPSVDLYVDWSCPACKALEDEYGQDLAEQLAAGDIALAYHPIAFLDTKFQSSRYSSRAGNAAACVANYAPTQFLDVQAAFFANQPAEGTSGLDDDEILALIHGAGVDDPEIDACVADEQFADWVEQATQRAMADETLLNESGRFTTPTVMINGRRWDGRGDLIAAITSASPV